MKKAIYKIPNGKLLKIFLEENNRIIKTIKINGDFFVYPEENIEKLETVLAGKELNKKVLKTKINRFFAEHPTNMFGVDKNSIVKTILECK